VDVSHHAKRDNNLMQLLAALIYWVIVALWAGVLITVLVYYGRNPRIFGTTRLLLLVVALDTCRNIVENTYFGLFSAASTDYSRRRSAASSATPHSSSFPSSLMSPPVFL